MNQRTTPISFRLPENDASFVASLEIDGAKTFSEKIRKLIQKVREESVEGQSDYKILLKKFNDLFSKSIENLKLEELESGQHSELLFIFSNWVAEASAYFISCLQRSENTDLTALENGIAKRTFNLFERLMRMGITDESTCYDKKIITNHIRSILEISEFINNKKQRGK